MVDSPRIPDARTTLFTHSLAILRMLTGQPDRAVRTNIGKLLKLGHDDASVISAVIQEAADLNPAEPIAWIYAAVRARTGTQARRISTVSQDWNLGSMVSPEDMAVVEEALRG